ncbi:MAG: hypothetical protein ACJA2Q_002693 [Pseudohongiellaceae bacterium]|jgi:hypothetical protein
MIFVNPLRLPIEILAKTTSYFQLVLSCLENLSLVRMKREESSDLAFTVPSIFEIAEFTARLLLPACKLYCCCRPLGPFQLRQTIRLIVSRS